MAIQEPFVHWLFVKHPRKFCRTGGFFYMETSGGDRIIVAAAVDNGANHLYFRASSTFVAYYRGILPLGNVFRWDFRKDVVAWLNSVVYHSFVRYSGQHVGRCWYVLEAPGPEFTGPTRIPLGLAHRELGSGFCSSMGIKPGPFSFVTTNLLVVGKSSVMLMTCKLIIRLSSIVRGNGYSRCLFLTTLTLVLCIHGQGLITAGRVFFHCQKILLVLACLQCWKDSSLI